MSLKQEFVTLARTPGANIRELCRRYGISPPTAYQLLERHAREGDAGPSGTLPPPPQLP